LARAAMGAGADGLFMEVCVDRSRAKCDGPNSVQVDELEGVLGAIFA
jgi:2-dehydro-3-deoxyphosphooctonate aldolase (KDO 8-P synthase)